MGKIFAAIDDDLRSFVEAQPLFFVATAPLSPSGHVNLSPKGLDTFRVLDERRVAYLDLTGSGNETAAHVAENRRITFMFCAFTGTPRILRIYGRGEAVLPTNPHWPELIALFPKYAGARQVIVADVEYVQTSCGFGVPRMDFVEERDQLPRWAESKGPEELGQYRRAKNSRSVDGLPVDVA
jgi:hypothetical protein